MTLIRYFGPITAVINEGLNEAVLIYRKTPPKGHILHNGEISRILDWAKSELSKQGYSVVLDKESFRSVMSRDT